MKSIIIDGVEYNLTQVEKDYEILSFKHKASNHIWKKDSQIKDTFSVVDGKLPYTHLKEVIEYPKVYEIHSVKRLSDGQIFSVGDKVKDTVTCVTDFIIKEFSLNGKHCYADIININILSIIKKPLFTTEDGVEIFEDDEWFAVADFNIVKMISANKDDYLIECDAKFSTEEAAEEFILWNKPSLSLKQIEDTVNLHWQDLEKLKEVIK